MFAVRFLVFPSGVQFTSEVLPSSSVIQVKQTILQHWPSTLEPLESETQLRLIYSGHELQDSQILSDVLQLDNSSEKTTNSNNNESNVHTVHVVVRKSHNSTSERVNNNNKSQTQTTQDDSTMEVPMDWHIHGCTFNEEETDQLGIVFQRKKGADNKMPWNEVSKVLHDYWKWSVVNKFHDPNLKFPTQEMINIRTTVLQEEDRATLEQFLSIFFLFDNHTPESVCPHGNKNRVMRDTEELHKALMGTDHDFDQQIFEHVFQKIDRDSDGVLNCKELELFFYMYSVNVSANSSGSSPVVSRSTPNTPTSSPSSSGV